MAHYKNKQPKMEDDDTRRRNDEGRRKRKKTKEGRSIWRMEANQLAKIEEDYQESNPGAEEKGEAK